jgi:hypothetical protein
MAEVTYYVALPFVAADDGIAAGKPTECFNPNAAVMRADAPSVLLAVRLLPRTITISCPENSSPMASKISNRQRFSRTRSYQHPRAEVARLSSGPNGHCKQNHWSSKDDAETERAREKHLRRRHDPDLGKGTHVDSGRRRMSRSRWRAFV